MRSIILLIIGIALMTQYINAQAQFPEFKEVTGTYHNEELGVEITLPEGWKGIEFTPSFNMIGGFSVTPPGFEFGSKELPPSINLFVIIEEEPSLPTPEEQPSPEEPQCNILSFDTINISGATGSRVVMECTDNDGKQVKMKGIFIQQEKNNTIRLITLFYMAGSNMYDKYVKDFDNSVNTLKISDAKSFTFEPTNSIEEKVLIDGNEVPVTIKSTSNISNFRFDENDKSITFTVEGKDKTMGVTEVHVSNLLVGPYAVTIDGKPAMVLQENEVIKIFYTHSIKEIKIIGTEVIPEFPIAVLPILALIIAVTTFITRTKHLI